MTKSGCCWNGNCNVCESATCGCVCHQRNAQPLTGEEAQEWQSAAAWCAREDSTGRDGQPLPDVSDRVRVEIEMCPDEWAEAIRLAAFAQSMEAIETNEVIRLEVLNEGDV